MAKATGILHISEKLKRNLIESQWILQTKQKKKIIKEKISMK